MTTDIPEDGNLVNNIIYFARALRRAGLAIGPGQIVRAIKAVQQVGFASSGDLYWALRACFLTRGEQSVVYAQMFRLFWRDPRYLEHMMALLLPSMRGVAEEQTAQAAARQAAEALLDGRGAEPATDAPMEGGETLTIDATGSTAATATFQTMDFERMSAEEVHRARQAVARLTLPIPPLISRRMQRSDHGSRIDRSRTLRQAARLAGQIATIHRQEQSRRPPDLVALCDISGSMSAYSRTILHFLHATMHRTRRGRGKVHVFTFGTCLANITPLLAVQEVDAALEAAGQSVKDWDGGTRIGDCLHDFNINWSRRVLSRGALVLLISDGLESGDPQQLAREAQRLQRAARRVIWLNPLLRWEGFMPSAGGIRALLPHVDCFRSAHNLATLGGLAATVARADDCGERDRLLAVLRQRPDAGGVMERHA